MVHVGGVVPLCGTDEKSCADVVHVGCADSDSAAYKRDYILERLTRCWKRRPVLSVTRSILSRHRHTIQPQELFNEVYSHLLEEVLPRYDEIIDLDAYIVTVVRRVLWRVEQDERAYVAVHGGVFDETEPRRHNRMNQSLLGNDTIAIPDLDDDNGVGPALRSSPYLGAPRLLLRDLIRLAASSSWQRAVILEMFMLGGVLEPERQHVDEQMADRSYRPFRAACGRLRISKKRQEMFLRTIKQAAAVLGASPTKKRSTA